MRWFGISNRKDVEGVEPEWRAKLHLLAAETAQLPGDDRALALVPQANSEDAQGTHMWVETVQQELRERAATLRRHHREGEKKPSLVLYAHGFNNDYTDAVEEYVELRRQFHRHVGADAFERQCLLMLFTWPSEGNFYRYLEDRDDARASYPAVSHMVHLLLDVTRNLEECISNVCLIAHSMGNYVFREAFSALAGSQDAPAGTFIDQFLMIGADVSNNSLEPGGKGFGISRFSNRVTVYYSPADSTLGKSKRKNGRARLGRTLSSGFETTPDNVVFVDCKKANNAKQLEALLGGDAPTVHASYRSVPAIVQDMFQTICGMDREEIPGRTRLTGNKLYFLPPDQP